MDAADIRVEERLNQLEIKASFAEVLVEQLNQIITRQQQDLDALARQMGQLRAQMPEPGSGTGQGPRDELPPHY